MDLYLSAMALCAGARVTSSCLLVRGLEILIFEGPETLFGGSKKLFGASREVWEGCRRFWKRPGEVSAGLGMPLNDENASAGAGFQVP